MPAEISVTVTPDLAAVTAHLKKYAEGGGKELKKQLAREMRAVGDQVVNAEKSAVGRTKIKGVKSGGSVRHKRGGSTGSGTGIRGPVAASIKRRNRLSGRVVGVEVRAAGGGLPWKRAALAVSLGKWRHPVFGDRDTWVTQVAFPPGFFWKTRDEMKPDIQRQIRALAEKYMKEALNLGA